MTENPYSADRFNAEQQAEHARQVEHARYLGELTDQEVIAWQPGPYDDRHLMEMNRRLKSATETLTDELRGFRSSSDAAADKLAVLTKVIIGLTVVLVILTGVLTWLAVRSAPVKSVPTPSNSVTSQPTRLASPAPLSGPSSRSRSRPSDG